MIICSYCGHKNRQGFLYCENCGNPLDSELGRYANTRKLNRSTGGLAAKATWGTARLSQRSEILLHVGDAKEAVRLNISGRYLLGRLDSSSTSKPDLDLMPFGALEKGVSRIHAAIDRSEDTLTITDMGSSNGTHLNGQKLVKNQPRVLRDGDEIRLGKLVTHIYFK